MANDQVVSNLFKATPRGYKDVGVASGNGYVLQPLTADRMPAWASTGATTITTANSTSQSWDLQHDEDKGVFITTTATLSLHQSSSRNSVCDPTAIHGSPLGVKWVDYDNDGWLDLIYT